MKTATAQNQMHTPGPWTLQVTGWINTPDAGGYRVLLINGRNFTVAQVQVDEDDGEQQANARLIAAAPETKAQRDELLEACKAATIDINTARRHAYEGSAGNPNDMTFDAIENSLEPIARLLDAAIARATGGTN